jgi:hypothetical protein
VLELAQELKFLQVGKLTLAVDGTKVLANANKHATASYEHAGKTIQQLDLEVRELLAKAVRRGVFLKSKSKPTKRRIDAVVKRSEPNFQRLPGRDGPRSERRGRRVCKDWAIPVERLIRVAPAILQKPQGPRKFFCFQLASLWPRS